MSVPIVDILLPAYNRAGYIDALIDSIVAQDFLNWRIIARDDASTDATQSHLEIWRDKLGSKMWLLSASDSDSGNLGCYGNFSVLLKEATAPYVMLADPDDVWLPTKVSMSLAAIIRLEKRVGSDQPCLVSTDVSVVGPNLELIDASFWHYQGVYPRRLQTTSRYLMENSTWGCTIIANCALIRLAGEIPKKSFHADWWLALVAITFGHVDILTTPTVLWRRHGTNTSEVSRVADRIKELFINPSVLRERLRLIVLDNAQRASGFYERYHDRLSKKQRRAVLDLASIGSVRSPIMRRLRILRSRLLFTSLKRSIGLLILI